MFSQKSDAFFPTLSVYLIHSIVNFRLKFIQSLPEVLQRVLKKNNEITNGSMVRSLLSHQTLKTSQEQRIFGRLLKID